MSQSTIRVLTRATYTLLIIVAIIITSLVIFLNQLDLDSYRLSLEQKLSSALKQPVQIGHSSLTYNHGLALEFQQVQIGPAQAVLAHFPQITATLKIAPLFDRKIILSQVQFEKPSFQVWLPFPERPIRGTSHELFNSLGISILTIHNADLTIYQKQQGQTVKRLEMSNLHAVLKGWQPGKTGQLVVAGQISEYAADFLLETRLPSSIDPQIWRAEDHQLQLQVKHFSTAKLPKLQGQKYPEAFNFELEIQGIPLTGTDFSATLSSSGSNEQIFSLAGRWTSSSQLDSITKLTGKLLKIPLNGEFSFIHQPKKYSLFGSFGAKNLRLNSALLKAWRIPNADKFLEGELDRLVITIKKAWNPAEKTTGLPLIGAEITISNLDWNIPELKQIQDFSAELSLKNQTLHIADGILVAGGYAVDFSGKIKSLFLKPQLNLEFEFNPDIGNFKSLLTLPGEWDISGDIPSKLLLTGPVMAPDFLLQADLGAIKLQFGELFQKQSTDHSKLQLQGNISGKQLQLDHVSLDLDDLRIAGTGSFQQHQGELEYHLTTAPINLDKLRYFSPLLQKFQSRGNVELSVSQNQTTMEGILKLKGIGAHLTHVIADLNHASGQINFDRQGFSFQNMKASLGESEFTVNGKLSPWKKPKLELTLDGKKVRAKDLVFPHSELTFYNLTGKLKIDAERLIFSPVTVRLEDNTQATVTGLMSNFRAPQIYLDIQSEKVDVLDIIKLFTNAKQTVAPVPPPGKRPPLLIKVSAEKGTLGGLHFQKAKATITGSNERLIIYPLQFNSGKGWCKARVEFDFAEQLAPLKISGHVHKIDATTLHRDLFHRPGLIKGSLKGDFYVEGNPSHQQFWQHARGGIHMRIKKGVLREFHTLAKVFSLLNVSQLFTGKLPDMDKEGMPFTLLESNIQIGDGKMTYKDATVISESMNLSAVGSHSLIDDSLDITLGVMPLRTVDKIITSVPVAGWILTGENKALLTAYFKIEGTSQKPEVSVIPVESVSETIFGLFNRIVGLPVKLIKGIGSLFEDKPHKKVEP